MEEIQNEHLGTPMKPLMGATFEDPQPAEGELPMIVWLRGDEPYAQDFSVDAEGAMEALGIKRSRLTQISGKELRVGRIRINRYIRPMYRPEDLESYKQWTRATATHMRSSTVISEAASKLEDHAHHLSENLVSALADFSGGLERQISSLQGELSSQQQAIMQMASNQMDTIRLELDKRLSEDQEERKNRFDEVGLNLEAITIKLGQMDDIKEVQTQLTSQLDGFVETVNVQLSNLQESLNKIQATQETQSNFNRDIGKALSMVLQFQREQMKKHEEIMEAIRKLDLSSEILEVFKRRPPMPMKRHPLVIKDKPS